MTQKLSLRARLSKPVQLKNVGVSGEGKSRNIPRLRSDFFLFASPCN